MARLSCCLLQDHERRRLPLSDGLSPRMALLLAPFPLSLRLYYYPWCVLFLNTSTETRSVSFWHAFALLLGRLEISAAELRGADQGR
jgi:hypothetical protein